jgi:hypothetical protein
MADSTTNLDTISASQASKEVTANNLSDALSPSVLFGRRATTTTGLTWGFYGGKFRREDGTIASIANGTITLTNNATNYLYANGDGVVTKVTSAPSGWPGPLAFGSPAEDGIALYQIVTSGGAVTSYTDYRTTDYGRSGGSGGSVSDGDKGDITVSGSGAIWTIDNDVVTYAKMQNVSAASRLLGRGDSGSGDPQEISIGSGLAMTGTTLSATGGGGTPGGSDTQVQFNDGGAFGGDDALTWNKTTHVATVGTTATPGIVQGGAGSAAAGAQLTVRGGAGDAGHNGGPVLLQGADATASGSATATGGAATLKGGTGSGNPSSNAGTGGALIAQGGTGGVSSGGAAAPGGAASFLGGNAGSGSGNNEGGTVTLKGGSATGTALGGVVNIEAGGSVSNGATKCAAVNIKGGVASSTGSSGDVNISTQNAVGSNRTSGDINLTLGTSTNTTAGGAINATGGTGGSGGGAGGAVTWKGGAGAGAGVGGAAVVQGGNGGATNAVGGNVLLKGGTPGGTGARGNVGVDNGAALGTTVTGGFFCIPTCAGAPTGVPANVPTGSVAMIYDTTNNALYVYNGAWKSSVFT